LHFYHNGKEVRRYQAHDVIPTDGNPLPTFGTHNDRANWDMATKFSFLSPNGGDPCYCIWYAGKTNWMAWRLSDGERFSPTVEQEKTWDQEATVIARRVVEGDPISLAPNQVPVSARQTVSPQGPSPDVCLKFLGRFKT